jgi:hypothetical protein
MRNTGWDIETVFGGLYASYDDVATAFAAAVFAMAFTSNVTLTGSIEGGYGTDDTAHAAGRPGNQGRLLSAGSLPGFIPAKNILPR